MSAAKEKTAKIIRCITVPPLLLTALIVVLYLLRRDIFRVFFDMLLVIFFLGIIPALAYPLQPLLSSWKDTGREGQRKLAFITSIFGYTLGLVSSLILPLTQELTFIFRVYFTSVIILTIVNKVLHIKASGHACSVTGPLLFLVYFIGWAGLLPCIILSSGIVWSSLVLKRHTVKELFFGALTCVLSFSACYVLRAV